MDSVFWSSHPFSQSVVVALLGLSAFWTLLVVVRAAYLLRQRRHLISVSATEIPKSMQKKMAALEPGPIVYHFRVFFGASKNGQSLDVDALLRRTWFRLVSADTFTRAVLSLFIIIGLFGTLVGLALALGQFRPSQTTGIDADNLRALFSSLEGAFAPSIVGVILTIIGVLIFSLYTVAIVRPLRQALERVTYDTLVHRFLPTPQQHAHDTLIEAQKTTQASLDLAAQIEAHATSIEARSLDTAQLLSSLTTVTSRLIDTVTTLDQTSSQFGDRLDESAIIYGKGLEAAGEQHNQLLSAIGEYVRREGDVDRILSSITTSMEVLREAVTRQAEVTARLQIVEDTYVDGQKASREQLIELVTRAGEAFNSMKERDMLLAEAVSKPVDEQLRSVAERMDTVAKNVEKGLSETGDTLHQRLKSVSDVLMRVSIPLDAAVTSIERIAETFSRSTEGSFREIIRFNELHESNHRSTREDTDRILTLLKNNSVTFTSDVDRLIRALGGRIRKQDQLSIIARMKSLMTGSRNGHR